MSCQTFLEGPQFKKEVAAGSRYRCLGERSPETYTYVARDAALLHSNSSVNDPRSTSL